MPVLYEQINLFETKNDNQDTYFSLKILELKKEIDLKSDKISFYLEKLNDQKNTQLLYTDSKTIDNIYKKMKQEMMELVEQFVNFVTVQLDNMSVIENYYFIEKYADSYHKLCKVILESSLIINDKLEKIIISDRIEFRDNRSDIQTEFIDNLSDHHKKIPSLNDKVNKIIKMRMIRFVETIQNNQPKVIEKMGFFEKLNDYIEWYGVENKKNILNLKTQTVYLLLEFLKDNESMIVEEKLLDCYFGDVKLTENQKIIMKKIINNKLKRQSDIIKILGAEKLSEIHEKKVFAKDIKSFLHRILDLNSDFSNLLLSFSKKYKLDLEAEDIIVNLIIEYLIYPGKIKNDRLREFLYCSNFSIEDSKYVPKEMIVTFATVIYDNRQIYSQYLIDDLPKSRKYVKNAIDNK